MIPFEMTARDWMQVIQMIGTFCLGAWIYIEKRNDKTNERVSAMGDRIDEIDRDLSGLIATSKTSPTHRDLSNVYHAQNRTDEKLNQLIGETSSQSDLLRLIMAQITKKGME